MVSTAFCEASPLYPDVPAECQCQPIHDWATAQIRREKLFYVYNWEDLQKIPKDTEGIELRLYDEGSFVEKKHLERLQHLPNLKLLRIARNPLAPDSTASLRKMTALEHLELPTGKDCGSLFETLASLKNLRSIELGSVTDKALAHMKACTKLEGIMLWQAPNVTDKGMENLAAMHKLKYLTVVGTGITGKGIRFITHCPDLKSLDLSSNTKLGDEVAPYIGRCKNLCHLELMDTQISDPTLLEIGKLKSLLFLGLGRTKVGDACANSFPALRQLVQLALVGTNISDSAVAAVSQCDRLESLDSADTKLTENCWKNIETLTCLKFLEVPKCIFTEESIPHIAKLRRLIDFESKNIGEVERNLSLEVRLESALPGPIHQHGGDEGHYLEAFPFRKKG